MATKSKNTNSFWGLLSWVCSLLVISTLYFLIYGVIRTMTDYYTTENVNMILTYIDTYGEIPYEIMIPVACGLLLFLAALFLALFFRQDRRQFEASIARTLSRIWVEVKLLLIFLFLLLSFIMEELIFGYQSGLLFPLTLVLVIYFLCLDIGHNHRFFRHNSIHTLLRSLNNYKHMTSFEQIAVRRLVSTVGVVLSVIVVTGFLLFLFFQLSFGPFTGLVLLGIIVFSVCSIVGTVTWYSLSLRRDLKDWNELMAQISEMYGGNLNAVNHVAPTSNLYICAMQLNMIRTGIQKAVEEGTKADRTKVELITNVSHDIKTPLTSIISYVELLKQEDDLPDHVKDYIQTISKKAIRLNSIVQDVFEVSKAATGNITLNMEDLDIGKLLQQTFGEMEETLQASPLIWKVDIPDTPLLVHTDGQRMYRVFQNLLRNCTQYSLEGSRVYVSAGVRQGMAAVSIRNISKNELTVAGEDLTARFVRGDQNRTTEGSGLGLSIAKSFTEACGGTFSIHTEGDLFTVIVELPLIEQKEPQETAEVPVNVESTQ